MFDRDTNSFYFSIVVVFVFSKSMKFMNIIMINFTIIKYKYIINNNILLSTNSFKSLKIFLIFIWLFYIFFQLLFIVSDLIQ